MTFQKSLRPDDLDLRKMSTSGILKHRTCVFASDAIFRVVEGGEKINLEKDSHFLRNACRLTVALAKVR